VLELSKESATLMTAEGVFKFHFKKLKSQNSDLSKELLAAVKRRFNERRNKDVAYLQTGKMPLGDDDFTYCSKTAMMSFTKKFVSHNLAAQPTTQNLDIFSTSENSVEEDLAAELQKSISNVFTGKSVKRTDNFTELQKKSNFLKQAAQKWKKSRQRLKLFSLLPQVASEHFRLQGASSQMSVIPCSINCFWYS
jgi:hypothetical protein